MGHHCWCTSKNKLQKREDALIKHMLTAADLADRDDTGDRGDMGDLGERGDIGNRGDN